MANVFTHPCPRWRAPRKCASLLTPMETGLWESSSSTSKICEYDRSKPLRVRRGRKAPWRVRLLASRAVGPAPNVREHLTACLTGSTPTGGTATPNRSRAVRRRWIPRVKRTARPTTPVGARTRAVQDGRAAARRAWSPAARSKERATRCDACSCVVRDVRKDFTGRSFRASPFRVDK